MEGNGSRGRKLKALSGKSPPKTEKTTFQKNSKNESPPKIENIKNSKNESPPKIENIKSSKNKTKPKIENSKNHQNVFHRQNRKFKKSSKCFSSPK